ncbi:MAG TPA: ABC transporter ATP-binding protein [Gemmatimonadales bacterium]|jgi:tungstate transport system ATP-binding protein
MSAALEAGGLRLQYHDQPFLEVESLSLAHGRTLALLGPNGAGKSALLRVLALLERPRAGWLRVLGERVDGERQRLGLRRRMATVFQAPLLVDRTVADNVALGLRFRGVRGPGTSARVGQWLERLGIAHLAARPARTLSGGEAQRASLARALVVQPELLFLDEPFASLDQHGREALALELEVILRESRIPTVLVTHDRGEAMMLADEAAVLLSGRVRQAGPVRSVLAHPADAQVARFLGVENLLPARVKRREGGVGEVEVAGQRVTVTLPADAGAEVLLALRAEDVHLGSVAAGRAPVSVHVTARVVRLVPFGVPYRVHLDAGLPLIALTAPRNVDRLNLAPGAEVVASFAPEAVHVIVQPVGGRVAS